MTNSKVKYDELILSCRIYEIYKLNDQCKVKFISDTEYFTVDTKNCSEIHPGDRIIIKTIYTTKY